MKAAFITAVAAAITFSLPALAGDEVKASPLAAAERLASGGQNPLSSYNRKIYEGVKYILLRSADKMPEEHYSFRPTDAVRNFGQIIGHVADAQYIFGSLVRGEDNPAPKIEQTKTSKADLIAALTEAFAYADVAYQGMTDASATELVKLFGGDAPKLGALTANNLHTIQHYGNLVTYLRLKGVVPPSSEPGFLPEPTK